MLHKRKGKEKCLFKQPSSTHNPSTTFINNLLHSKSTYFYKWWNYTIPSVCILALLVGLYVSVNPIYGHGTNKALAIQIDSGDPDSGDNTELTPSLSLTVTGADQAATPAEVGTVAYRYNTLEVTAEGYRKYDLTLSAMLGFSAELRGKNNPNATIAGVGRDVIPDNFGDNTWGYAATTNTATDGSALTYNSVPDYGGTAATLVSKYNLKGQAATDTYKLVFAAKFGADAPSDNYQGQMLVSVIGTPGVVVGLADITNMQEMTSEICANSEINETQQLRDTRDDKLYWVTKLADNNCWMTQNLDLDLSSSTPLTSATSDVSSDWTPVTTMTGDINSGWTSTQTKVQSWDPGTYYYKYVSASDWTGCNDSANMSSCPSKSNWSTTAPATEGEHYHVGNYYSWNAATAGTGGSITTGEASASICPAGWKLPTRNNTTKGSFGYLMGQYGLRTDNGSEANVDKVRLTPMYFIPAGYVNALGLGHAGVNGHYWSSSPVSDGTNAFELHFYSGTLRPSYTAYRYSGFSVRCLADF